MNTNEINFEDILNQFIENIDKISIKNTLRNKLVINRITSDTIEFITISKIAQLIFNNSENMKYIESKISEIIEKPMRIKVNFENKEDYFAKKIKSM
jgi:hypothetical protein